MLACKLRLPTTRSHRRSQLQLLLLQQQQQQQRHQEVHRNSNSNVNSTSNSATMVKFLPFFGGRGRSQSTSAPASSALAVFAASAFLTTGCPPTTQAFSPGVAFATATASRTFSSAAPTVASAAVGTGTGTAGIEGSCLANNPRGGAGGAGGSGGALFSTSSTTTSTAEDETTSTTSEAAHKPKEIFRSDYRPLPFIVSNVELDFNIRDQQTTVTSVLTIQKNPKLLSQEEEEETTTTDNTLVLDGDSTSITLQSIELVLDDDSTKPLVVNKDYVLDEQSLTLLNIQDNKDTPQKLPMKIKIVVTTVPEQNTQLSGLYKSGPMYCTQCEAMGFRRITYYPDRPDNVRVVSRFVFFSCCLGLLVLFVCWSYTSSLKPLFFFLSLSLSLFVLSYFSLM